MQAIRWNALIPVGLMCLLGVALSIALISQHSGKLSSECAAAGGKCDSLQSSRWAVFPPAASSAEIGTGIPVAAWGVGYFTFLAAWLILAGTPSPTSRHWHWLPVLTTMAGGILSVVLTGVMWQSGAWCPLCLTAQGLNLAILVSILGAWPRSQLVTDEDQTPDIPRGRLAISTLCLGACAVIAGTLYSQQLRLNSERQLLAERIERLHQDTDVVGWLYDREEQKSIPVRDDDLRLGAASDENASTLVVFSDAHCPSCQQLKQRLTTEIVPKFKGKLQVVLKHFPLCDDCNAGSANVHPQSCQAAYLTEAARLQQSSEVALKLWDLLKTPRSRPWSNAEVTTLAEQVGLDAAQLLQDAASSAVQQRVAADAAVGRKLNVRAIPAMFLDGREISQELWESPTFWQLAARGNLTKLHTAGQQPGPVMAEQPSVAPAVRVAAKPSGEAPTAVTAADSASLQTKEQRAVGVAADAILKQHDADESGSLESKEWAAMTFNPKPYDLDKDGTVSREELIASIASVSSGAEQAKNPDGKAPSQPPPKLSTIELGQELEISGPTLTGATFDLKDYRGKVVVVDFWASWCHFCVEETPYLQRLYGKYHDQGLEIVGVSSDKTADDLRKFVDDNKLPWPQVYFDEEGKRGRDNPVNQQHLLRGLPQIYVVDRDGKVIAQVPRRHQVEEIVAHALGVAPSPGKVAEGEVQELARKLVRPIQPAEPDQRTATIGETLDIQGATLDGDAFNVTTWRGKPVIVAFWASWCPHCKKELPNLLAAYERHHADGLEIVGINLDKTRDQAMNYLAEHPHPWPTLYRDEDGYRGFDHPLSWRYGIKGVPAVYLLDGEGKLVSLKARGENLELEVARLLGKQPATVMPAEPTPVKPQPPETARSASTNPFDYSDEELAGNLIESFDTNKDGVLQAEEWKVMPNSARGMDRDGDGLITRQELQVTISAAKKSKTPREVVAAKVDVMNRIPPADIAAQIIKQYDTNENGQLEVEEWSKLPGKPKVFDTNSDDVISLEELAAAITSSRRITSATDPAE